MHRHTPAHPDTPSPRAQPRVLMPASRHTQEDWLPPPWSQAEAPAARLGRPCHPPQDVTSLFPPVTPPGVRPLELSWRAELAHMAGNMLSAWASTHWGPRNRL